MATLTLPTGEAVSYDDVGHGPPIVLVHGSPGTSKAWHHVAERLADRFRVVAPTLPDPARTKGWTTEHDNSDAAAVVEALVAAVGQPRVLAGHSHGGVVALNVALRGRVTPGAMALFEPVAVEILRTVGDAAAYAETKAVFDGYIAAGTAGEPEAVRTMIDYWFGPGAYDRLPGGMKDYLRDNTAHNIRDVRATFHDRYSAEAVRGLAMPVLLVVGGRSPAITHRIASSLVSLAPHGSLVTLDGADHALTTTHANAVADLIASLVDHH